ncbi:hypothetical protein B0H14DRAFT_2644729 [Mycena olivaceomarginata]|nr:hypothetical protein B0H14DRAFT_2644729 [Mycena olivaceomarginata]
MRLTLSLLPHLPTPTFLSQLAQCLLDGSHFKKKKDTSFEQQAADDTRKIPETKNAAGRPPNCACKALDPRWQRLITTPDANIVSASQPTRRATATGEDSPPYLHPRQQLGATGETQLSASNHALLTPKLGGQARTYKTLALKTPRQPAKKLRLDAPPQNQKPRSVLTAVPRRRSISPDEEEDSEDGEDGGPQVPLPQLFFEARAPRPT